MSFRRKVSAKKKKKNELQDELETSDWWGQHEVWLINTAHHSPAAASSETMN